MSSVEATLAERGARYGDFTDHAHIAQRLQSVMRGSDGSRWNALSAVQRQALTVIADKIARILTGDPNYTDNWHDIQGYAKLAEDRCVTAPAVPPFVAKSEWIVWRGGDQPVDALTKVDVNFRNGSICRNRTARSCTWAWRGSPHDIVAYRPAAPADKSEWIGCVATGAQT